jgi:hypothetical protein
VAYLKNPTFREAPDKIADRRERFERLNEEARLCGAWIISTPGSREVTIEVLPSSGWPDVLRGRGYRLEQLDEGQRILPNSIQQPMRMGSKGGLVHHAGIHKTRRFSFDLP